LGETIAHGRILRPNDSIAKELDIASVLNPSECFVNREWQTQIVARPHIEMKSESTLAGLGER
jgi:hypothetical protein